MQLLAPASYLTADATERALVCNGCGPGSWRLDMIPDSILGLDISAACNVHDWMYEWDGDREKADVWFLANMVISAMGGSKWLLPIRMVIISNYFLAVRFGGEVHHNKTNTQVSNHC